MAKLPGGEKWGVKDIFLITKRYGDDICQYEKADNLLEACIRQKAMHLNILMESATKMFSKTEYEEIKENIEKNNIDKLRTVYGDIETCIVKL
jgi:hypothetical protein